MVIEYVCIVYSRTTHLTHILRTKNDVRETVSKISEIYKENHIIYAKHSYNARYIVKKLSSILSKKLCKRDNSNMLWYSDVDVKILLHEIDKMNKRYAQSNMSIFENDIIARSSTI